MEIKLFVVLAVVEVGVLFLGVMNPAVERAAFGVAGVVVVEFLC